MILIFCFILIHHLQGNPPAEFSILRIVIHKPYRLPVLHLRSCTMWEAFQVILRTRLLQYRGCKKASQFIGMAAIGSKKIDCWTKVHGQLPCRSNRDPDGSRIPQQL